MLALLLPLADVAVEGLILALVAAAIILVIAFVVIERVAMSSLARTLIAVIAFLLAVVLIFNAVD